MVGKSLRSKKEKKTLFFRVRVVQMKFRPCHLESASRDWMGLEKTNFPL